MPESSHRGPAWTLRFTAHLARNGVAAVLVVAVSLTIGALGYHGFEGMSWIDAYYSAAMILTSMGPSAELKHDSTKLFAIFYALFSGIVFISVVSLMLAPVLHRFLHRFHLEAEARRKEQGGS